MLASPTAARWITLVSWQNRIPVSNLPNSGAFYAVKVRTICGQTTIEPTAFYILSVSGEVHLIGGLPTVSSRSHGQGVNTALLIMVLAIALTYPPVQNLITTNGYITGNVIQELCLVP